MLSTVDPYFTIDGISRAFDVYYRTTRPLNSQGEEYELVTPGASVRFGVPFSEYDTVFFGIGAERTEISGATALPNSYFLYREQFGETSSTRAADASAGRATAATARWCRRRAATRASTSTAAPLGDAQLPARQPAGASSTSRSAARFTFGVNAEIGYGKGLGGRPYPIFKNFYGGGLGTVRGFDQGSLGPVDVTGAYIGGNRRFNINNELYLPVPGAGNDRTLRIFVYRRRRQRLGREREGHASTACAPRPASACAGSPRSAR